MPNIIPAPDPVGYTQYNEAESEKIVPDFTVTCQICNYRAT